jgi:hypothetical protein
VLDQPKRRKSTRARRIISIAAGVALAASAVVLATTANADVKAGAQAATGRLPLPPVPANAQELAVKKLPPGARKATGINKPGTGAKPFQSGPAKTRIVGGTAANTADYPGVVGIQTYFLYEDEPPVFHWYVSTCTGTVLSPTKILTAAHCSVDNLLGTTEVIAGRNVLDTTENVGHVAQVSNAWTHQGYNLEALYSGATDVPRDDVTVLTLTKPLPSQYVPVSLAAQGAADPAGGTTAKIVGYGITSGSASDSGILREGDVSVATDATCGSAAQWGSDFDPNRMMCAGAPGVDTCHGDSGGPIFTGTAGNRVQVGITDWGTENCTGKFGVYEALNHYAGAITQQITAPVPVNLDWSGDGHSDLIGRNYDGELEIASGSGLATGNLSGFTSDIMMLPTPDSVAGYTKMFRVNNWSGDGKPSIFARDSAGRLYNYKGTGFLADFDGPKTQIGSGWNAFTDIMVTNNWTGNGRPNLMGRTSDGKLVIYTSDGAGGWSNPKGTQIGTGWNSFNTVLTPGDWLGDGHQTLIGRTPAGALRLYQSNGAGGWVNPAGQQIGTGWGAFSTFMSPGDFNGDGLVDLVGVVRSSGVLKMYNTNGRGAWLNGNGRQIGSGWQRYNLVF